MHKFLFKKNSKRVHVVTLDTICYRINNHATLALDYDIAKKIFYCYKNSMTEITAQEFKMSIKEILSKRYA